MSCQRRTAALTLAIALLVAAGRSDAEWTAKRLAVVKGFQTPESAAVEPNSGTVYVSNVVAAKVPEGKSPYWAEDGVGFISRMDPGGKIDVLKWKERTAQGPLNAPKGICFGWGRLWVADITRLVWLDLSGQQPDGAMTVRGAQRLNDVATDGAAVYVSDTATGNVHRIARGDHRVVEAPKGVNGITFSAGKMYAVSWSLHEVYRLDRRSPAQRRLRSARDAREGPVPLGLAAHFKGLDGIEVLDDGTLLVSDFPGNKVSAISPDRKSVRTLIETTTPADIGLDRKRLLLYVPLFTKDLVEVYQLNKR